MTSNNSILSDAQRSLLAAMLNRIVPCGRRTCPPPATSASPASWNRSRPDPAESVARCWTGWSGSRLAASERGGSFADLSEAAQIDALRSVEASSPEFFQELVTQTYRGYYTNETVCGTLGYRPPNREDYDPLPFDESLLEPVRQRGQIWTETG